MIAPVGFDALKATLHRQVAQLPDHQTKGPKPATPSEMPPLTADNVDDRHAVLCQVIARRQAFFTDIQALRRYMVFDH